MNLNETEIQSEIQTYTCRLEEFVSSYEKQTEILIDQIQNGYRRKNCALGDMQKVWNALRSSEASIQTYIFKNGNCEGMLGSNQNGRFEQGDGSYTHYSRVPQGIKKRAWKRKEVSKTAVSIRAKKGLPETIAYLHTLERLGLAKSYCDIKTGAEKWQTTLSDKESFNRFYMPEA